MARIEIRRNVAKAGKLFFLSWAVLSLLATYQLLPAKNVETGVTSPPPSTMKASGSTPQLLGATDNRETESQAATTVGSSADYQPLNRPSEPSPTPPPPPSPSTPSNSTSDSSTRQSSQSAPKPARQPEPKAQPDPILLCVPNVICI